MEKKKFKITLPIVCYIIAVIVLMYAFYSAGSTIHDINEYYSSYEMSASAKEYITYTLQALLQPLIYAVVIYMCGRITEENRTSTELILAKLDENSKTKAPAKKKTSGAKNSGSDRPKKKSTPKDTGEKKDEKKPASKKETKADAKEGEEKTEE